MSKVAAKVMSTFYRKAEGRPERLPWHRDQPSRLLSAAVVARGGNGRALDVGCGAGVFTVWLAKAGMASTGIDLFPGAIAMAVSFARNAGVHVELVQTDLFAYVSPQPFELVYDSGCLHSLVGGNTRNYRNKVLEWLTPGGEYVLEHWGKRHALDWRPIGPRRRSKTTIEKLFAPELRLVDTEVTDFAAPLPFGPMVRGVGYRFRRVA
jgi:SAM-dependent methyltransferase